MAGTCAFCGDALEWSYKCKICEKTHCYEHRMPEEHDCPRVMAAKHIEKFWLKKDAINVTTGMFAAVCFQHGYISEYTDILVADQMRSDHIKNNGCAPEKVWLRRIEDAALTS